MDLRFTADELAFRDELRAFIRDNLPADIRDRMRLGYAPSKEDTIRWQRILNKTGWAAYNWPKEWGGPGWTPVQRMIFLEENQMAPAPEVSVVQHHDDRPGADPVRHRGAEAAASCRAPPISTIGGARAFPSRAPAPTSPR